MEIYRPYVRTESIPAILDGSKKFQYLLIEKSQDNIPDYFIYKINGEYFLLRYKYHYNGYTGDFYDMVSTTKPDHDSFTYMLEKKWYTVDLVKEKKMFCVYMWKKLELIEINGGLNNEKKNETSRN